MARSGSLITFYFALMAVFTTATKYCHDGYSAPHSDWLIPYQAIPLAESLSSLGCNPAKCENHADCNIPACKVLDGKSSSGWFNEGWMDVRGCTLTASSSCNTLSQCSSRTFPSSSTESGLCTEGAFTFNFVANRLGMCNSMGYSPGYSYCTPLIVGGLNGYGSYNVDNVDNPLDISTCGKSSMGPISSPGSSIYRSSDTVRWKRATYLLTKRTVCLKSTGTGGPKTCFSFKSGRCVKLRTDVWPDYVSAVSPSHIEAANNAFEAGEYDDCDDIEKRSMAYQVSGN